MIGFGGNAGNYISGPCFILPKDCQTVPAKREHLQDRFGGKSSTTGDLDCKLLDIALLRPCLITPRSLLVSAFGLSFIGYLTVRMFYDGLLSLSTDTLSTLTPMVVALTVFEFMTGSGGNACITAALNTSARCFPARSVSFCRVSARSTD